MQNKPRGSTEKNFITLLNFIADPAVIVDWKGLFLVVNYAFVELTGLRKKELIGTAFFDLPILSAENKATLLENLEKRLKGLHVEPYEISFKNRTGETRHAEVKAKKVEYSGHLADLVVFRDITRRKENEKRLKEYSEKMEALVTEKVKEVKDREEKYRELTESISDVFFAMDKDLKYTYWNKASESLTGILAKDAIGKRLTEVFPNVKGSKLEQFYQEVLRTKQPKSFLNNYSLDNKNYVFEISAYPAMDGLSVFVKDISERKKAEEQLRASENRLRHTLDNMLEGCQVISSDWRYLYVNDAAAKQGRYRKEKYVGKTMMELYPSIEKTMLFANIQKCLKKNEPMIFDNEFVFPDGDKGWFELSVQPVPEGVFILSVDITERKEAEEALKESEEKFRNLSEESPNMIFITKQGKVVYANKKCEEVMGYTKEEFYASSFNFFSLIAPECLKTIRSSYRKHLAGEEVDPYEYTLVTKAGKRISEVITTKLVKYEGEHAILGIITDITERKQMETKLREAEKRYHALFDQAPLGILLIDPETAIAVEFNEEASRQLGYSREDFAKLEVSDYELIETPEETRARMKKILHEGKDEFETKHRTKDGKIRDVKNTVQVIELAGKKFFHLIILDITEQKKIERELKIERDKLEAVTENIGAGLAIISKDYRIQWANKLLQQFNGDCEGKLCYATFNRRTDVCPDCGVKKIFETGAVLDSHEYIAMDGKGNPQWIELIVTPIKNKNGTVIAALELAVNITERKIMENKLADYSQKLEKLVEKRTEQLKQTQAKLVKSERLATIGELAAMVGHDLRNPLTGIMGAAYYLKTKNYAELGAKGKEMLETIENAINYSNKIVNDLLEYSRDLKLELAGITPKALLENALSLFAVPEKIKIVDATEANPTVKADMEKMRRVFVNLIKNAFDAMPEGGTLTVKSREAKDKLEIAFKDTGTGMSKETLSKLEGGVPLFTTKAKGMGFGLPICKRIAEAHGGKISVESKIGKGTTITVTIPVNPEPLDEGNEQLIFNESMLQTITARQKSKSTKN